MAEPGKVYVKYDGTYVYLGIATSLESNLDAQLFDLFPPNFGISGDQYNAIFPLIAPNTKVSVKTLLDCGNKTLGQCLSDIREYQRVLTRKTYATYADKFCIQLDQQYSWKLFLALNSFSFTVHPGKPKIVEIDFTGKVTGILEPDSIAVRDCSVLNW